MYGQNINISIIRMCACFAVIRISVSVGCSSGSGGRSQWIWGLSFLSLALLKVVYCFALESELRLCCIVVVSQL